MEEATIKKTIIEATIVGNGAKITGTINNQVGTT